MSVSVQVQGQGFVEQEHTTDNGEGELACSTYIIHYCAALQDAAPPTFEILLFWTRLNLLLREAGCVLH